MKRSANDFCRYHIVIFKQFINLIEENWRWKKSKTNENNVHDEWSNQIVNRLVMITTILVQMI